MFFDNLFDDYNPFGTYSFRQPRPQTSTYEREDKKSIVLREILNDEYNYMCFDCHRELRDLDYFDLMNGIFLCCNCAQHHARLSKEITKPMTGHIRSLDENDLLLLYYGGNKNLFEFIRKNYPLLENMQAKEMYSTKAMDYYRKLLRSKAYDEPEPEMPGKKMAYSSIFQKKINPVTERKQKNLRERRFRDPYERNDDERDIFSSTFFGDDLFNRNRQQKRKIDEDEENYFETEPADINKREAEEKDDAGMKIEKRNNSHENEEKKEKEHKKAKKETKKYKKIEKKVQKENTENTENELKVNPASALTINQIGELNRYPEAMEIDGMECE